ncbi:MAG: hypothetical protein CMI55_01335 [Parcubacteria group bacterium]|nr:hypothetical protein [Parcubacteria group bacterium]|tara:strand:- start:221 stop:631 length:411 start_codon:yes stop_codon:yes gene_type:complete
MKINILGFAVLLLLASSAFAKEEVVFTGIPTIKISEGGSSRIPEKIANAKSIEYKCTITMIGDKYYWATRENVELVSISSGAYITFLAINGSGYIRIIQPGMKEVVAQMDVTEKEYDYVEHMLIGLKSVTYYGQSK